MNTEVLPFFFISTPSPQILKEKGTESEGERRPEECKDQKARGNWISFRLHCAYLQVYITEVTDYFSR